MKFLNGSRRAPLPEHIDKLEALVRCKLPGEFTAFLAENNGGVPRRDFCKNLFIQIFLPLTEEVSPNIRQETEFNIDDMPPFSVRLGSAGESGPLLLDLKKGSVILDGTRRQCIAKSIMELVSNLEGEERPEWDYLSQQVASGDINWLRRYVKDGNSIEAMSDGRTIVEKAAIHGDIQMVRECVRLGAMTTRVRAILERVAQYDVIELLEKEGFLSQKGHKK